MARFLQRVPGDDVKSLDQDLVPGLIFMLPKVQSSVRSFVLTLFIFKALNYELARTLTERVV